jgi:uncharacterized integral membrane protein
MSATPQTPTPGQREPSTPRRSRREQARTWTLVVLAVLMTLFAVLNFNKVKVHYLVGTGDVPLTIVIVVSLLVGVVLTHFAERRSGRRQ